MQITSVCVLGGSGFVGRHLVNELYRRGYRIKVLTRNREKARDLWVLPNVDVVEADIGDEAELCRQLAGMDAAINLVGILHQRREGDFRRLHADLPLKVAKACLAAGVPRLLHMSALQADERGPSAYLRSKGWGETRVLDGAAHGLAVTVFRPSVIFGPGDAFLNLFARLLRWLPVVALACPYARFQPVFVGDVARVFAESLERPETFGRRYDLCGPRAYSLRQLVVLVGRFSGHARPIVSLGHRLSYLQAWVMEMLPGSLLTRDNVLSMQADSVCVCPFPPEFGFAPTALEAVAPSYLAPLGRIIGR
ncbi:MAG: complex I NDUFA9 subunit family protein [Sulfuricellaceae bacterium]|nr:complex I NDUFA9 subunit family protein [Sulfuricellaceae bacterium]